MQTKPTETTSASSHQMVTEEITLHTGEKTIKIGLTDQKLSGHAGQATIWSFALGNGYEKLLRKVFPHHPHESQRDGPCRHWVGIYEWDFGGSGQTHADRLAAFRPDLAGVCTGHRGLCGVQTGRRGLEGVIKDFLAM